MKFTNVLYTAGVSGRAGGSESLSGNFSGTIFNFLFSSSNVYLRSQTGGKVDPLIFYRRGYTQKIGDKTFLKPIEYYKNATVPSK
ncbi:MAG: hypothetical protein DI529_14165 [Chryseobacterium sp.]|nr:MAG: hypothetical protein DI529_14165 [Chryseobacterium sp.]